MAFIHCDGFDRYTAVADIAAHGWFIGNSVDVDTTGGRYGGGALVFGAADSFTTKANSIQPTTFIHSFAFFLIDIPISTTLFIRYRNGVTNHVDLRVTSSGHIAVTRNGATLATSTLALAEGVWYRLEFKAFVDNAGSFELRIDGVNVASGAADTQNAGTANITDYVISNSSGSVEFKIDDELFMDTSGTEFNDFLGDFRIDALAPTAEGDNSDFTPSAGADNALMVDDAAADDDTTYVESATAAHQDLHVHENLPITPNTILGVVVGVRAKEIAAEREITLSAKSGTTTGQSSAVPLNTDYEYHQRVFTENPDTTNPWTASEVNGGQFGYRVSS